jgi:hypothetical protein
MLFVESRILQIGVSYTLMKKQPGSSKSSGEFECMSPKMSGALEGIRIEPTEIFYGQKQPFVIGGRMKHAIRYLIVANIQLLAFLYLIIGSANAQVRIPDSRCLATPHLLKNPGEMPGLGSFLPLISTPMGHFTYDQYSGRLTPINASSTPNISSSSAYILTPHLEPMGPGPLESKTLLIMQMSCSPAQSINVGTSDNQEKLIPIKYEFGSGMEEVTTKAYSESLKTDIEQIIIKQIKDNRLSDDQISAAVQRIEGSIRRDLTEDLKTGTLSRYSLAIDQLNKKVQELKDQLDSLQKQATNTQKSIPH